MAENSPPTATLHQLRSENAVLRQHLATLGQISLAGELPRDDLLQQIVETGRALLNARFAALGLFDSHQRVTHFFTSGLSIEQRLRIGTLPVGSGLLGHIVQVRRIVRVPRISGHPMSVGFPPGHPPMTSFLGGPIARGDRVYGNLYLTDRLGAEEFSSDDELLLSLLASQAAAAIENAERFASAREDERTTQALFDVGRALATMTVPKDIVDLIAAQAINLLGSDVACVGLRDPDSGALSWTIVAEGVAVPSGDRLQPLLTFLADEVLRTGKTMRCDDLVELTNVVGSDALLFGDRLRSVVAVSLGQSARSPGIVLAAWRKPGAIPPKCHLVLDRLADRAAIAIAQAQLHAREQAATRLAQVERSNLEVIFDSLTDAVYTTDLTDRLVRVNHRAIIWSGCDRADAIGQPAAQVFRLVNDTRVELPQPLDPSVMTGEINLVVANGDLLPVELLVSAIRDSWGETVGKVHVLRDLRPQREVEQLKANIISLVSHELRTPLSHIKGYASSLLQTDVTWDSETQHDFIVSIERQADRLARLITDLLEISRLDAGGTASMELVPIHPSALVERGIRLVSHSTANHLVSMSVSATLPRVIADSRHLERVLGNLIENAAKYSTDGSPILIDVSERVGFLVFAVHDRGPGLTADEKIHLFERFYRSPRVKHRTPGTGLGLAICYEIVKSHGGEIWVESVEGQGSVFRFTLPKFVSDTRIES